MVKIARIVIVLAVLLTLFPMPDAQARTLCYLQEKSLLFLSSVDARLFLDTLMTGERQHILKVTKSLLDADEYRRRIAPGRSVSRKSTGAFHVS